MVKQPHIRKVIFPVGGLGSRFLPATKSVPKELFPLVEKPLIQWAIEEAANAGCREFIFVNAPQKPSFLRHFQPDNALEAELTARGKAHLVPLLKGGLPENARLHEVIQAEPLGLGHAILCARELIGDDNFAVILPDDVVLAQTPCLAQLCAQYQGGNLIAAEQIDLKDASRYGIIAPPSPPDAQAANDAQADNDTQADNNDMMLRVGGLVEKPAPEDAPSNLAIIGRYILSAAIMDVLASIERGAGGEYQLTDALAAMRTTTPTYAMRFDGRRYDCGSPAGYIAAGLAYSLSPFGANMDIKDMLLDVIRDETI